MWQFLICLYPIITELFIEIHHTSGCVSTTLNTSLSALISLSLYLLYPFLVIVLNRWPTAHWSPDLLVFSYRRKALNFLVPFCVSSSWPHPQSVSALPSKTDLFLSYKHFEESTVQHFCMKSKNISFLFFFIVFCHYFLELLSQLYWNWGGKIKFCKMGRMLVGQLMHAHKFTPHTSTDMHCGSCAGSKCMQRVPHHCWSTNSLFRKF